MNFGLTKKKANCIVENAYEKCISIHYPPFSERERMEEKETVEMPPYKRSIIVQSLVTCRQGNSSVSQPNCASSLSSFPLSLSLSLSDPTRFVTNTNFVWQICCVTGRQGGSEGVGEWSTQSRQSFGPWPNKATASCAVRYAKCKTQASRFGVRCIFKWLRKDAIVVFNGLHRRLATGDFVVAFGSSRAALSRI